MTTTAPAAIAPLGSVNCEAPRKNASATGAVRDASVDVRTLANRKSFHAAMNVRIPAVNTPGMASGRITLRNACIGVAPSICAAFSRSQGISLKNAERM